MIAHDIGDIILEEEIDKDFEPTEEEIRDYAMFLGIDLIRDKDLLWIAKEGLKAPLPQAWKPMQTKEGEIYYFNFETKQKEWEHPCDGYYRKLYQEEKKKKKDTEKQVSLLEYDIHDCDESNDEEILEYEKFFNQEGKEKKSKLVKRSIESTKLFKDAKLQVKNQLPKTLPIGSLAEGDIIIEEEIDKDYELKEEDILDYAEFLGMDQEKDKDLFWIAKEGLKAPLPQGWKTIKTKEGDIYYFNFETKESQWDHPCHEQYKKLYQEEKEKKKKTEKQVDKKIEAPVEQVKNQFPWNTLPKSKVSMSEGDIELEEEIDKDYEPNEEEILEYAKYLGMDIDNEKNLLWIAREGLMAPLPKDWIPIMKKEGDIYYFNFETKESKWEHPCDEQYKKLYQEEKQKKQPSQEG